MYVLCLLISKYFEEGTLRLCEAFFSFIDSFIDSFIHTCLDLRIPFYSKVFDPSPPYLCGCSIFPCVISVQKAVPWTHVPIPLTFDKGGEERGATASSGWWIYEKRAPSTGNTKWQLTCQGYSQWNGRQMKGRGQRIPGKAAEANERGTCPTD